MMEANDGHPTSEGNSPFLIRRSGVKEGSLPHAAEFGSGQWDLLLSEMMLGNAEDAILTIPDVVLYIGVSGIAP